MMDNSFKKFGIALLVLVTCVFIYESGKKKPMHWYETYSNTDKNPYGLYVLDQEIDRLIKSDSLTRFTYSVYDFLSDQDYDTLQPNNLIIIAQNHSDVDQYTADYLQDFMDEGNTALILQSSYTGDFLKAFGLSYSAVYPSTQENKETNTVLELTNTQLTKQKFSIKSETSSYGFEIADSVKNKIDILGYKTIQDTLKQVNLVRVKHGKGQLILGFDPIILTNYYLLKSNNHLYAEGVFSYLPNRNSYCYVTSLEDVTESNSILRFIFGNVALKWAWYFFLLGLLVFVLFTAKRKQRIIPIQKPVKNTTIQFVKTVSNLYIQTKDYNDLIQKSIIYTLEKIRRVYNIDTAHLDENFVTYYHLKSNKEKQDILNYVNFVTDFRKGNYVATQEDLVKLNQLTQKIIA